MPAILPRPVQYVAVAQGPQGEQGKAGESIVGPPGKDGRDGIDGKDGRDGKDGKDGESIVGPVGPKGDSIVGPPGKDGKDGLPGKDGRDGVNGKDGKDGRDGRDGVDGKDGKNGVDGKDSTVPGPKGEDSIVPGPKGDKGDAATLNIRLLGVSKPPPSPYEASPAACAINLVAETNSDVPQTTVIVKFVSGTGIQQVASMFVIGGIITSNSSGMFIVPAGYKVSISDIPEGISLTQTVLLIT